MIREVWGRRGAGPRRAGEVGPAVGGLEVMAGLAGQETEQRKQV